MEDSKVTQITLDIVYQMDKMNDAIYDRFGASRKSSANLISFIATTGTPFWPQIESRMILACIMF
jgi:hypothetical protein